ncbi:hypothetical protein Cgig2_031562 [Carnegiea gigantea]|uniref:Uncharacterized protein n=1 Tax=Carnegiea gigantea TaxID=171969 RepID=A0A9Q1GTV9_9CARY|nr:hypothetical protein Cgig2_031562 [Carnegiea gigantea]
MIHVWHLELSVLYHTLLASKWTHFLLRKFGLNQARWFGQFTGGTSIGWNFTLSLPSQYRNLPVLALHCGSTYGKPSMFVFVERFSDTEPRHQLCAPLEGAKKHQIRDGIRVINQANKPDLLFLIETMVSDQTTGKLLSTLAYEQFDFVSPQNHSGGIWGSINTQDPLGSKLMDPVGSEIRQNP